MAARGLVDGGFGEGGVDVGAISNYFNYAINFLIPGVLLQAASWLQRRKHTSTLVIWLVAAAGIYISLGFRYRLVLLAVPLVLLWFMARSRRPNLTDEALISQALSKALIFTHLPTKASVKLECSLLPLE